MQRFDRYLTIFLDPFVARGLNGATYNSTGMSNGNLQDTGYAVNTTTGATAQFSSWQYPMPNLYDGGQIFARHFFSSASVANPVQWIYASVGMSPGQFFVPNAAVNNFMVGAGANTLSVTPWVVIVPAQSVLPNSMQYFQLRRAADGFGNAYNYGVQLRIPLTI